MSVERIGMEKALPMFALGIGCIFATIIVFGILCGNMLRTRRKIEKNERENEEKQEQYPLYILTSQSQNSIKYPSNTINNTNQSAAILSSSRMAIALDPTFKIHPYHHFSDKRIVEL